MTRKQREKQELRFRILDAAREIFAAGGEEAVTLRRVAERIEYSATTIYLHFEDKNALLNELCLADFAAHNRSFRQAEREPDPLLRLRKVAAVYVDFALQNPALYRLMFSPLPPRSDRTGEKDTMKDGQPTSVSTSNPAELSATPYDFLYSAAFKAMAAGSFSSEYKDVASVAQMLWGALHGILSLHLARARYPAVPWKPVETAAETLMDCLIDGLTSARHGKLLPR